MQIVANHPNFSDPGNIAALATYLSGLDANPKPVVGDGDHLRLGQESFTHICAACHGANGRGDSANRVPRIAGQHYPYLRRQIEAAAELHRTLAPPEMTSALRGMYPQEKDALADYVSRLGTSDVLLDSNHNRGDRTQPNQP
jgi:cytochrome c553